MSGWAIAAAPWEWHPFGRDINWGDVPTWLAFIAAASAGWYALRALRLEQERDGRALDDASRRQAEMVSAWVVRSRVVPHADDGEFMRGYRPFKIHLANPSGQPVYDLELHWEGIAAPRRRLGVLEPGATESVPLVRDEAEAQEVGQFLGGIYYGLYLDEQAQPADAKKDLWNAMDLDERLRAVRVSITFTDQSGRRWRREPSGSLTSLTVPHSNHRRSVGRKRVNASFTPSLTVAAIAPPSKRATQDTTKDPQP